MSWSDAAGTRVADAPARLGSDRRTEVRFLDRQDLEPPNRSDWLLRLHGRNAANGGRTTTPRTATTTVPGERSRAA
jgi:hypothetical protein